MVIMFVLGLIQTVLLQTMRIELFQKVLLLTGFVTLIKVIWFFVAAYKRFGHVGQICSAEGDQPQLPKSGLFLKIYTLIFFIFFGLICCCSCGLAVILRKK